MNIVGKKIIDISSLGIGMETTCVLISFVIMLFFLAEKGKEERIDKFFVTMLSCNIFALIGDISGYTFLGTPGHNGLLNFSYTLSLLAGFAMFAAFFEYIDEFMKMRMPLPAWVKRGGLSIAFVAEIICVIQFFVPYLFYVDENGQFVLSNCYSLTVVMGLLLFSFFMVILIRFNKYIEGKEMISLLSFSILPMSAECLQVFFVEPNFVYFSTTMAIFIMYSTIHTDIARKLKEAETNLAQARLNLAMSQIQPHFMYNSLTAIAQLCAIDPKRAQRATIDFSNYLRGNLDSVSYTRPIPFSQELKHLNNYLALELMRFDDRLSVEYDIRADHFMVPALSVQPLVENAVKHGICKKPGGGTVWISTREDEDSFKVIIKDDGIGFDVNAPLSNDRSHIGVANVKSRIESMMDGRLDITSEVGAGTTSILTIPKNISKQYQEGE